MCYFYPSGIRVGISFYFIAFLSIILLADKTGMMSYGVAASALHEIGHFLGYAVVAKLPRKFTVSFNGFKIEEQRIKLSLSKEVIIISAGPILNFICFAVSIAAVGYVNEFAALSFVVGIFNCIPINVLDGGRVVRLLCLKLFSFKTTDIITNILSFISLSVFFICSIFLIIYNQNITLLITTIYLTILFINQKEL